MKKLMIAASAVATAMTLGACSQYGSGYDRPGYVGDNWDAPRYYRDGPNYTERRLSRNDRVYRGSDGRYYCQRPDGTSGLVIGAAAGGTLGAVIAPGGSSLLGALIGGAAGAAIGESVEKGEVRCR